MLGFQKSHGCNFTIKREPLHSMEESEFRETLKRGFKMQRGSTLQEEIIRTLQYEGRTKSEMMESKKDPVPSHPRGTARC